MKAVVGSGNAALDQALVEGFAQAGHEAAICAYAEALIQKGKAADVAVVGAELPGADGGLLAALVALRLEGARVAYLPGDREQADRDTLTQAVAVGVYDIAFDPVDPGVLVAAVTQPPSLRRALSALRRPGERAVGTARLGTALQGAAQTVADAPAESTRRPPRRSPAREPRQQRPPDGGARRQERGAPEVAFAGGLTVFLGALPGSGTTRAAVAYARKVAGDGNPVVLVDAHPERAHVAHYVLGRDLDLLDERDAALSWRHARGVPATATLVAPNVYLSPLAPDPDLVAGPGAWTEAQDVMVRWTAAGAKLDVVCRAGAKPEQVHRLLDALGGGGGALTVAARARGLSEPDRLMWERELGVAVMTGSPRATGPVAQLTAQLTALLRANATIAPSAVVDLGAPQPLVQGSADPRIAWAAQMGRVIVVTRDDDLATLAAERLMRTLRSEAERAGRELQAELVVGVRRAPAPTAV